MKNKVKNIMLGALATVGLLYLIDLRMNETDLLNGEVEESTITPIVFNLLDDPTILDRFMTTTLVIHSPGGSVNQLNLLRETINTLDRKIITKVPKFAASAAADIFLLGQERLIGKNAKILFHEVRLMLGASLFGPGIMVTYTDLKSILETGKLAPNSEHRGIEPSVVELVKKTFGPNLKLVVEMLQESHEDHIKFLSKRLNMTREQVTAKLLIPNVDVTLDFKEALELGVATGEL